MDLDPLTFQVPGSRCALPSAQDTPSHLPTALPAQVPLTLGPHRRGRGPPCRTEIWGAPTKMQFGKLLVSRPSGAHPARALRLLLPHTCTFSAKKLLEAGRGTAEPPQLRSDVAVGDLCSLPLGTPGWSLSTFESRPLPGRACVPVAGRNLASSCWSRRSPDPRVGPARSMRLRPDPHLSGTLLVPPRSWSPCVTLSPPPP